MDACDQDGAQAPQRGVGVPRGQARDADTDQPWAMPDPLRAAGHTAVWALVTVSGM